MASQKFEDVLNLALETDEIIREESNTLNVGYNREDDTWQVIVRYSGDISFLENYGVRITYLISNYGILDVPAFFVPALSGFEEIIYVEMPKKLYYSVINGRQSACISGVQNPYGSYNLYGDGIICACIDSGERVIIMSS